MSEIFPILALASGIIVGYAVEHALTIREERKLQRLRDNKRRETIARRQRAARDDQL